MKKTLDIALHVIGTINQTIEIFTEETPEQFRGKIDSGDYLASVGSGDIMEIPSMKKVGKVIEQSSGDNMEMCLLNEDEDEDIDTDTDY